MNTLEIKINHKIKNLDDLYKYAYKQFIEYEKIEGIDNWKKYDFSIDCSDDQMKFKDMLQIRFIEELTEATLAINEPEHFLEEITDALNFLLSSYLMILGPSIKEKMVSPEIILNRIKNPLKLNYLLKFQQSKIKAYFYTLVEDVGSLCNLLKNRPWAQSNFLVSMEDFNERLKILWRDFWLTMKLFGLDCNTIYELFERKYLVNKWRIKTGY